MERQVPFWDAHDASPATAAVLRAYQALGAHTPMLRDCGALCGAACCRPDADGQGGVYLFPGEAALLANADWCRVTPADFAPMLVCGGTCLRECRPLGCRLFPLTPARSAAGRWSVRLDARARAMCPLSRAGLRGLNPAFLSAAREAVRAIAQTTEGEAFLEAWVALEEAYRAPLWE